MARGQGSVQRWRSDGDAQSNNDKGQGAGADFRVDMVKKGENMQAKTMISQRLRGGIAVLALALAGCGAQSEQSAASGDAKQGAELFAAHCAACHGASGRGDGPLAADLPTSPTDLTQLRAANDGEFPMVRAMSEIYGYPGKYHRGLMPEFGPVLDGPQVAWTAPSGEVVTTPQALLDVLAYLRTLQAD